MNETNLSVLVVDDEPPARDRLERLIGDLPGWKVVGLCGNGMEALESVTRLHPAVVLLDIRMPGMDGIEAARHLAALEAPPAVVFTTAYDEYALDAFDSQAVGYLLKPVRRERLASALQHAARLSAGQLAELTANDSKPTPRRHVAVRVRDELKLIPMKHILYFRADQKYVTVRHVHGEDLIDESLKLLAEELSPHFVRVHRSFLVAVAHVDALKRDGDGKHFVRLRDTEDLVPVSRRQVGELKRALKTG